MKKRKHIPRNRREEAGGLALSTLRQRRYDLRTICEAAARNIVRELAQHYLDSLEAKKP